MSTPVMRAIIGTSRFVAAHGVLETKNTFFVDKNYRVDLTVQVKVLAARLTLVAGHRIHQLCLLVCISKKDVY